MGQFGRRQLLIAVGALLETRVRLKRRRLLSVSSLSGHGVLFLELVLSSFPRTSGNDAVAPHLSR